MKVLAKLFSRLTGTAEIEEARKSLAKTRQKSSYVSRNESYQESWQEYHYKSSQASYQQIRRGLVKWLARRLAGGLARIMPERSC